MQYINGLWLSEGSHSFTSINPSTGKIIWQGHAAGVKQVEQAVSSARAAFPAWAALGYDARYSILDKFKSLISSAQEELISLIVTETGKPLWDATSEVTAVIGKLGFTHDAYQERTGTKSKTSPTGTTVIRHRPHGVMAVYGPYNFPAHLPNGHIMPALLAGNTIVFKPSEQTPYVAEWMVKQWHEAGLPAGVLNLVQGERETGIALSQASVDGILFTGSTATGTAIHKQLAGHPEILLALEMGGNNPLIVCDVSDLNAAVLETVMSAFTSSGQRCTCARRLILPPWPERDKFIKQLQLAIESLVVGAPTELPSPFMGPVISLREARRLIAAQDELEKLGGNILVKMHLLRKDLPFVSPALIDMTGIEGVPDEEYFGPLLQLYRAESIEDAIHIANTTRFGLSAAILSDDPAVYQQVSNTIRAGIINWNRQTTGASGTGPFGGIGISGNHRPAGYYSSDYCSYPIASVEQETLQQPAQLPPGITLG